MTDTYIAFMAEYKALCLKYGVCIQANMYDSLELWPLDPATPQEIEPEFIQDWTSNAWTNPLVKRR